MKSAGLPKKLPSFYWYFLKKHWVVLLLLQFFSLAWALDHTLWPYVVMTLIDTITNYAGDRADAWGALAIPIVMGISLWITVEVFFRLAGILNAYIMPKIEASVRMTMVDYVLDHSHHYFSNNMAGSIANKISDMPQSMTRLLQEVITLFVPVAVAIIIATTMFAHINSAFALILGGWLLLHLAICLAYSKNCFHYSEVHSESRSILTGQIVDSLSNHSNVRLFARNRFEKQFLSIFQKDEMNKNWTSLWWIEKMKISLGVACFFGNCIGLIGYMLYSWQQGHLTTGEVVFIFNTSWNITMMAWIAGLQMPMIFKEIGTGRQALTIIKQPHDIIDIPNAVPLVVTRGEIVFDNVSFQYHKQNTLFQNKNIVLRAGEKVGLVGFSGSGKTTFVNLILRNYDILSGHIYIDGQDIARVTQESLRSQISIIPQDPSLFHRTIMENIRYGKLDATDEEVIEASMKAYCHDFIEKLPEKYQTQVGERGVKLSGGQRQRIAIARAILKNAPILILDEATSALDSVTEREIQEGIEILMQNHTTLVIAHRLSTLSGMDRIIVFKDGKILEDGSHQELIESGGHYAQMWEMQAGGFIVDYADLDEEE